MADRDNRKNPRYPVSDAGGSVTLAQSINIVNVSLDGIAFSTTKNLRIGKTYLLKIPDGEGSISVKGEVSWCKLNGSIRSSKGQVAPVYLAGMQLLPDNSEATALAYGRFVKRFSKELCTLERILVEVTIAPGTKKELTLDSQFPVRKLDREAIRLVSDTELPLGGNVGLQVRFGRGAVVNADGQVVSNEKTEPKGFLSTVRLSPLSPAELLRFDNALQLIIGECS